MAHLEHLYPPCCPLCQKPATQKLIGRIFGPDGTCKPMEIGTYCDEHAMASLELQSKRENEERKGRARTKIGEEDNDETHP
jgi:hypothetical protein